MSTASLMGHQMSQSAFCTVRPCMHFKMCALRHAAFAYLKGHCMGPVHFHHFLWWPMTSDDLWCLWWPTHNVANNWGEPGGWFDVKSICKQSAHVSSLKFCINDGSVPRNVPSEFYQDWSTDIEKSPELAFKACVSSTILYISLYTLYICWKRSLSFLVTNLWFPRTLKKQSKLLRAQVV